MPHATLMLLFQGKESGPISEINVPIYFKEPPLFIITLSTPEYRGQGPLEVGHHN